MTAPVRMDDVLTNSFKDYHVRGFDYICFKRSPTLTMKLYFFNGDVSKLPEVVNPHDHRYNFDTICVTGEVENIWFKPSQHGAVYQTFKYRTPLNGGSGFTWDGETRLREAERRRRVAGERYSMQYHEMHTIRMVQAETVLMLRQYEDRLPVDAPTRTFTLDKEPPSLSGLYNTFTADEVLQKLKRLGEMRPDFEVPIIL